MNEQITYTQVIDEKTGEIKYVPNTPPPPQDPDKVKKGDDKKHPRRQEREDVFDRATELAIDLVDEKLTEVLKNLEANNKRLRYAKRLENGKLDGRRLVAYRTSDKLFKKKAIKHRSYQFTIMLDTSGSMLTEGTDDNWGANDCKLSVATQAVVSTVKSLEELGLPVCVVGMNQEVRLLKALDTPFQFEEFMAKLKHNFTGRTDNGDNCSGTAEAVAYQETLKYIRDRTSPKTENVVFVLSDGEPGSDWSETPVTFQGDTYEISESDMKVKDQNQELADYWRRQTDIKAYGIGIKSTASQVPRHKRIDDTKELAPVMAKLIEEILL